MIPLVFSLAWVNVSADGDGRCSEEVPRLVLNQLVEWKDADIRASTCKTLPTDDRKMLVAIAAAPSGYDPETSNEPLPYFAAMTDSTSFKVVASYQGGVSEDATRRIYDGALTWDTARYDLAPGVRAIGLRIDGIRGASAANSGGGEDLTLFVRDGPRLKPVLKALTMHHWSCDQGDGVLTMGTCYAPDGQPDGLMTIQDLKIAVAKESTRGFHDLILILETEGISTSKRYRLRYTGNEYPNDYPAP